MMHFNFHLTHTLFVYGETIILKHHSLLPFCLHPPQSMPLSIEESQLSHGNTHYLKELIAGDVDIIILQEHWLWPHELSTLSSLYPSNASMPEK